MLNLKETGSADQIFHDSEVTATGFFDKTAFNILKKYLGKGGRNYQPMADYMKIYVQKIQNHHKVTNIKRQKGSTFKLKGCKANCKHVAVSVLHPTNSNNTSSLEFKFKGY